jgi:MFS family permease
LTLIYYSGRKRLCLVFCLTYAFSCCCIALPYLPILLFGRVCGGVSTAILYSVFESWLVTSAGALAIPSTDLSTIFGRATLVNGFVATGAGVASNQLVVLTNSFASPFIASGVLLLLAYLVIRASWGENFGGSGATAGKDLFQLRRLGQAWRIVRDGKFDLHFL